MPGVAHDAVDLAELVERGLDDVLGTLGLGHAVVVGNRTSTGVFDLLDDVVGHVVSGAGAVTRTTEVVDHDAGAFFGEGQRVLAAQTSTGSGDDDNAILHSGHEDSYLSIVSDQRCDSGPADVRTAGEPTSTPSLYTAGR